MTDASPDGATADPRWQRIVFKLSGEAFAGPARLRHRRRRRSTQLAAEIVDVRQTLDVDVAVVVGGGNIWRGRTGADAGHGRHPGRLHGHARPRSSTRLALQDALERLGQPTRVQTAIEMPQIAEPYIRRRAIRHLEKGRVVIFAGGTGNPFFTTDTAAALRAAEIEAEALLKGTHSGVDGVYTADPRLDPDATKFDEISYLDVMTKDLKVMDATAITFCMDNEHADRGVRHVDAGQPAVASSSGGTGRHDRPLSADRPAHRACPGCRAVSVTLVA